MDDSLCASGCPGAEGESCGGQGFMDVWVTGSKNDGDGKIILIYDANVFEKFISGYQTIN